MECVFGASAHAQVLKQAQTLLEFMCRRECLTLDHLSAIWNVLQVVSMYYCHSLYCRHRTMFHWLGRNM